MLRLFNWIGTRFSVGTAWSFLSWGLPLAALLAGAAAGGWVAWQLGRAPLRAENADLRTANAELRARHAEESRLAALAGAARLQAAQDRSDALAGELLATLADNAQLTEEVTHALETATTGRACLSGGALRVLRRSPGITVAGPDGLPTPRAGTAAAGAAPAGPAHAPGGEPRTGAGQHAGPATELEATDTAVAGWIAAAGTAYETCRARLSALIAWHERPAPQPPTTQEPH